MNNIDLKDLSDEETEDLLPNNLILLGWRGSISHGTYRSSDNPNSVDDKDLLGTYVAPLHHYIGFRKKSVESYEKFEGVWDVVGHEIRKFADMLLGFNPNVVNLLWLPENMVIYETEEGKRLRDNRDAFISKKEAYNSFRGYAKSQMDQMKKSRDNLDDLHRLKQLREDIVSKKGTDRIDDLTDGNYVNKEHLDVLEEEYVELADKYYSGYLGKKRKRLVRKHGYDPKQASHMIRLLRMGIEFLVDGELNVHRHDNQELVNIKEGQWEFDEVLDEGDRLFDKLEDAYINSDLPTNPDRERAERVVMQIISSYYDLDIKELG
jgi:predicted nucleotidyltransferase